MARKQRDDLIKQRSTTSDADERRPSRRRVLWIAAAGLAGAPLAGIGAIRLAAADRGSDDYDDHDDDDDHDDRDDDDDPLVAVDIPAGSAVVEIFDDDDFTPSTLTIDAGQMITFVNYDGDDHTATGSGFDTGIIPEGGGTASVVFDTPGRYLFACLIHPEMVGEIQVRDEAGNVPERAPASPVAAATPAGDAAAAVSETRVNIIDLAFEPATITVSMGTEVVWTNTGQLPHTVTADDIGSDVLNSGQEFRHTFTEAGTVDYFCAIHPGMTGRVVVEPA